MLWNALDLGGCFLVSYEEQIIGILATPFDFMTDNMWKNLYGKGELELWQEVTSTYWAIPGYDLTRSLFMYTSCIWDVIMALFIQDLLGYFLLHSFSTLVVFILLVCHLKFHLRHFYLLYLFYFGNMWDLLLLCDRF